MRRIKKMVPAFSLPGHVRFNETLEEGARRPLQKANVELRDVAFADSTGQPVLGAVRVRATFSVLDLVRGRFVFRTVALFRPTVDLRQGADGRWNVARLFRTSPATAPARRRPCRIIIS